MPLSLSSRAVSAFLKRERRRLQIYRAVEISGMSLIILLLFLCVGFLARQVLMGVKILWPLSFWAPFVFGLLGLISVFYYVYRRRFVVLRLSLRETAAVVEKQSPYFHSQERSELCSAAAFLDEQEGRGFAEGSPEFKAMHLARWNEKISEYSVRLRPSRRLVLSWAATSAMIFSAVFLFRQDGVQLPNAITPWTPTAFEVLLPFSQAEWKSESGALSGIAGSRVRFVSPASSWLRVFLFVKESGVWSAIPCEKYCETTLQGRGQYAVGTLFSRSAFYPLQVVPDESPRVILMARVQNEWVPSPTLEILNEKSLPLQMMASDDIRVVKAELHHRMNEEDEILGSWSLHSAHEKKEFSLSMEGWKGGRHEIFVAVSDDFRSVSSAPVVIVYADENTLREKRLQDLRGLVDEWVHVLGDLIDSDADQKLAGTLEKRLRDISYPKIEEASMLAAYVKELQALGGRIENWAKYGLDFSQLKNLISRTEKQILYGLSLIFQEKTGDLENTGDSLQASQNNLSKMLEDIRNGKTELNSKELEEAFQKLAKQLEELQQKVKQLPQGPTDDLVNREALESQAEESESLQKRIEDIQKQMAEGDKKGALRELESLLNQLSILSKEMERSLGQWKANLDQGALQSSQQFNKKLEEIKKKQEELAKQTQKLKEKAENMEAESQRAWKPVDPKTQKKMEQQFKDLAKKEDELSEEFNKARQAFDTQLQNSEMSQAFRSEEQKDLEQQIEKRMDASGEALRDQRGFEALTNERESIDLLNKAMESQKQMQKQMQSAMQPEGSAQRQVKEHVQIVGSEGKGEKERRRRIMDSLKQKVDERYQKSHEQYFEDLLQR